MLENINSPEDLKKINIKDLPKLSEEIREFLIDSVSKTGGSVKKTMKKLSIFIFSMCIFLQSAFCTE